MEKTRADITGAGQATSRCPQAVPSGDGDAEVFDFEADAAAPDLEAREHRAQVPAGVEALGSAGAITRGGVADEVAQAERPRVEVLLRDVRDDRPAGAAARVLAVPDAERFAADRRVAHSVVEQRAD